MVGAQHLGAPEAEPDEGDKLKEHTEAVKEVGGGGHNAIEAEQGHAERDDADDGDAGPGGAEDWGACGEEGREEAQVSHAEEEECCAAQRRRVEVDGGE